MLTRSRIHLLYGAISPFLFEKMEFLKFGCIFMKKILSETIRLIRDEKTEYFNEASITSLVCGILYSYGWNVFDPNEVAPQYNIRSEKHPQRVDLALKLLVKEKS